MDASWPRRGLAFLVLLVVLAGTFGLPALAHTEGDMEGVLERYEEKSEAKLEWLESQLEAATNNDQRAEVYATATTYLNSYADQALGELAGMTAGHIELVPLAEELAVEIQEMKLDYLAEAAEIYEESLIQGTTTTTTQPEPTTTTTTKPKTTTTTKPEPSTTTTTTVVETPVTSSTTTSTTSAPSTTTTVTVPSAGLLTRSSSGSEPVSTTSTTAAVTTTTTTSTPEPLLPDGSTGGSSGTDPSSGATEFALVLDAPLASDAGFETQDDSVPLAEPGLMAGLGSSESLPFTGMLVRYVPADLPGNMTAPVVGVLAIVEMVAGAFVASFRRLGGPLTAAGLYLIYTVWRYLVPKKT